MLIARKRRRRRRNKRSFCLFVELARKKNWWSMTDVTKNWNENTVKLVLWDWKSEKNHRRRISPASGIGRQAGMWYAEGLGSLWERTETAGSWQTRSHGENVTNASAVNVCIKVCDRENFTSAMHRSCRGDMQGKRCTDVISWFTGLWVRVWD